MTKKKEIGKWPKTSAIVRFGRKKMRLVQRWCFLSPRRKSTCWERSVLQAQSTPPLQKQKKNCFFRSYMLIYFSWPQKNVNLFPFFFGQKSISFFLLTNSDGSNICCPFLTLQQAQFGLSKLGRQGPPLIWPKKRATGAIYFKMDKKFYMCGRGQFENYYMIDIYR